MLVIEATAGGTARHIIEIALGCHRRGVGVHLVCSTRRSASFRDELRRLRDAGVAADEIDMRREISPLSDGAAVLRLRRLILRTRPDVLHLHSSKAGALGRGAAVALGHRRPVVIYTPHDFAFLAQPGKLNRCGYWCAERALIPLTDRLVAVSESEGRDAARLGAGRRVVVIPNGVSEPTQPALRLWKKGGGLRVGWLGRLAWQKDPLAAVKASFVLSRLGVGHEMLMGGDGPDRGGVVAAIRSLRVEGHIRLLGVVGETAAFHAGVDLLLTTSRSEGLSYAVLDAMAHGVPVVGFDVAGVRDLVRHGVTGLLAPAGDAGALAAHMARLARDPALRQELGAAAQRLVLHDFRLADQIDRLCELYRSLAVGRAARVAGCGPLL
jgi:glycosyltransferase involved in cell wall biosynthesis